MALRALLVGVAASALLSGTAFAADLIIETPIVDEVAMGSMWDGVYLGVQGGYDFDGYWVVQGVLGANMTFSENFLLGVEGAVGPYSDFDGSDGYEGYVAARAGFTVDSVLIYALGGGSVVDGDWDWVAGGGVEAFVADNVSVRGQVLSYGGDFIQATIGAMYHF